MLKKILLVICISILIAGTNARGKNKNLDPNVVDQSQEGQWNVRADLEKFVILLIPTPAESSSSSSSPSLLDFLFRSIAPGKFGKGASNKKHHNGENYQETKHFIESKTAPYHVDISTSKYQIDSEDTLVANSPSVTLVKNGAEGSALMKKLKKIARNSKAIILTVNTDKNGESNSVA